MPSPPVIPTESRTTLSEAEGDVRLSGGIPAFCPSTRRVREFYRSIFPALTKCVALARLPPLDAPSRTCASHADTEQFPCTLTRFVPADAPARVRDRLPLRTRVSRPNFFNSHNDESSDRPQTCVSRHTFSTRTTMNYRSAKSTEPKLPSAGGASRSKPMLKASNAKPKAWVSEEMNPSPVGGDTKNFSRRKIERLRRWY
jgi:hypothetical protein